MVRKVQYERRHQTSCIDHPMNQWRSTKNCNKANNQSTRGILWFRPTGNQPPIVTPIKPPTALPSPSYMPTSSGELSCKSSNSSAVQQPTP
jgi:hypothetical protein